MSGTYEDFAVETAAPLENGVPGNRLGGLGSGLAYAGGNTFLALPDRGPLPFTLTPMLIDTTLLSSKSPLVYGTGAGVGLGSGTPP